jgi:medium-chain acyl-[acyl-carrier-protein] hydrolase
VSGRSPWFSIPSPNPAARLRLVCFPYAGAGASAYFSWSRALRGRPVEVRAVQPPGRENRLREAPFTDLHSLVEAIASECAALADRPFAFFGHSMGSLVAFEVTRALRDRGGPVPVHLFVSGANAPDVPRTTEPLYPLSDADEFVAAVATRYGGLPKAVRDNRELLDVILPVLRADMRITESYVHKPAAPLPIGIAAYTGDADPMVRPELVAGWRAQSTAGFASRVFPGDHFFLAEHRDALIADVMKHLEAFA